MCSVSSQIFYRNISEKIVQYFSVIIPLLCHLICSGLTHSDTMSISFSSDLEISILRSLQFKISTWKKTSSCCFCSIFFRDHTIYRCQKFTNLIFIFYYAGIFV